MHLQPADSVNFTLSQILAAPESPVRAILRKYRLQLGLAAAWLFIIAAGHWMGVLWDIDEGTLDWRMAYTSHIAPDNHLALIEIDELPPNRPWPWSRLEFSLLLDRGSLMRYGPRSVVIEPVLAGPDPSPREDSRLAEKLHLYERHVLAAALVPRDNVETPAPAGATPIPTRGSLAAVPRFGAAYWPYEEIATRAAIGAANLLPQGEGVTRWLPLIFVFRDQVVPSLALQAAAAQLGADLSKSEAVPGYAITLRDAAGKRLRVIPIDDEGRMRVRFHPKRGAAWTDSFAQFLVYQTDTGNEFKPKHDLRLLRGRQVWVGRTDPDATPVRTIAGDLAPVRLAMAGTLNIVEGDLIQQLSTPLLTTLYAIISALVIAAFYRLGIVQALVFISIASASWLELSVVLFRAWSLSLPVLGYLIFAGGLVVWCAVATFGPRPVVRSGSAPATGTEPITPKRFTPRKGTRPANR
ncbi:hypothetical protein DB346_24000 [Verrucomicrobia bacterium LW23]|nr:hypothetical protein DB346_24000 [Verrucomicrobia bacterium LW23]